MGPAMATDNPQFTAWLLRQGAARRVENKETFLTMSPELAIVIAGQLEEITILESRVARLESIHGFDAS